MVENIIIHFKINIKVMVYGSLYYDIICLTGSLMLKNLLLILELHVEASEPSTLLRA